MYSRKASLLQRPMHMMIIVATPDRNIAMAPPDLIECRPISPFANPGIGSLINSATAHNLSSAWDEFIHDIFPSDEMKEHNFESFVAPGIFNTLLTVNAAATTGHKRESSVQNIWTE